MGRGRGAGPGCAGSRLRRSRDAAGGGACVRSPRRPVPCACSGGAQTERARGRTGGRTRRRRRGRALSGAAHTRREPGSPRAPRRLLAPWTGPDGTGRGGLAAPPPRPPRQPRVPSAVRTCASRPVPPSAAAAHLGAARAGRRLRAAGGAGRARAP